MARPSLMRTRTPVPSPSRSRYRVTDPHYHRAPCTSRRIRSRAPVIPASSAGRCSRDGGLVHAPGGVAMPVPFVIAEAGEDATRFAGDNSLRVSFGGTAAPAENDGED